MLTLANLLTTSPVSSILTFPHHYIHHNPPTPTSLPVHMSQLYSKIVIRFKLIPRLIQSRKYCRTDHPLLDRRRL